MHVNKFAELSRKAHSYWFGRNADNIAHRIGVTRDRPRLADYCIGWKKKPDPIGHRMSDQVTTTTLHASSACSTRPKNSPAWSASIQRTTSTMRRSGSIQVNELPAPMAK